MPGHYSPAHAHRPTRETCARQARAPASAAAAQAEKQALERFGTDPSQPCPAAAPAPPLAGTGRSPPSSMLPDASWCSCHTRFWCRLSPRCRSCIDSQQLPSCKASLLSKVSVNGFNLARCRLNYNLIQVSLTMAVVVVTSASNGADFGLLLPLLARHVISRSDFTHFITRA